MSVTLIREHYDYHHWANRRLFGLAVDLGDAVYREMGPHWSLPTLKGMFAHICGADHIWLARWKGNSPDRILGDADFPTVADLRTRWDALEAEQKSFLAGLGEADLVRPVVYKNTLGQEFRVALGALLLNVVNHATHHRSEAATMMTIISGSPPDTGINTYRTVVVKC